MTKRTGHDQAEQPLEFLVVARTGPGPYPHPVEVALHPDGAASRVSFSIGPHAANAGGQVPLTDVLDDDRTGLDPRFATEFDAADLHWLVPYLVRLHAGEDTTDEIVAAYRERHGKTPRSLLQVRFGER
ncbi:hypothetical protein [Pimelobacter sp. 30-1]|uniref:hypothetical protein n=1 Tax=Pimelobacter sp. 30-1 TaxID=2004991 RepID=UPI001C03B3A2|nr:hypothetical protein [Pimelobacter sp. 30-1]MBU2698056.1 hypothetical protein [Pimelobacter sp. 30-1]